MISLRETDDLPTPPPLDWLPDWVEAAFRKGGWLETEFGLEHRPQQQQMAIRTAQAWVTGDSLLFEAGTGVGKSLAYLLPGIVFAVETGRPLVVSTHTISLQEQIQQKDLPLIREFFAQVPEAEPYAKFKTALLIGKGNYLCETRLGRALQNKVDLFDTESESELIRIQEWARTTKTGIRHELIPAPRPDVWDEVNAEASTCNRKNCGEAGCSYRRARKELEAAHVRIVNHSLLFSLIHAGMPPGGKARGVLFPDDVVVLDEAHTVPSIASDHFGLGVSSYSVSFALRRLFNPKTGRGVLRKHGKRQDQLLVEDALEAAESFFNELKASWLKTREVARLRETGWAEPLLQLPLKRIIDRLGSLESRTEDEQTVVELRDHRGRIHSLYDGLSQALELSEDDQVYWLERAGKQGALVHIRSAPIEVAPLLNQALFQRHTSVVMTSATLALGNRNLDTFRDKSGAWNVDGEVEASPFDFKRRMRIRVNQGTGVFRSQDGPARAPAQINPSGLAEIIRLGLQHIPGGALVLFTSYSDLTATGNLLRPDLNALKRPLLIQGDGRSRTALTREMLEAGNGVLLGTDSFWTGVDLPGPALTQVYITRLPFENPSHPLAEARSEWVRHRGGNPFSEITIPEAVLKFRQGLGRLIRKRTDAGYLFVLDPRVLQKEYGRHFLDALPHQDYRRFTVSGLAEDLKSEPPLPGIPEA